jgi:hypothetical protein
MDKVNVPQVVGMVQAMNELKLVSQYPIRPLVEGAIRAALHDAEVGIRTTEQRLREFEAAYQMLTEVFVQRYEDDEFEETLEFGEWIGEYRMLQDLREDAVQLRGIKFVA